MSNASIACLLAVYCSGWFSRPNDDHRGWSDVYVVFEENQHADSSLFLFDHVFAVNGFSELVLLLPPFGETTLFHMLKKDYRPINASSVDCLRNPQARNTHIQVDVTINRPQMHIRELTDA